MTAIDRVRSSKLPVDQLVVCGSGLLDYHKLRNANDLDLLVSPELFDELRDDNAYESGVIEGDAYHRHATMEIWRTWYGRPYADVVRSAERHEGILFMSLADTIAWKERLNRGKDRHDIKLLKDWQVRYGN